MAVTCSSPALFAALWPSPKAEDEKITCKEFLQQDVGTCMDMIPALSAEVYWPLLEQLIDMTLAQPHPLSEQAYSSLMLFPLEDILPLLWPASLPDQTRGLQIQHLYNDGRIDLLENSTLHFPSLINDI